MKIKIFIIALTGILMLSCEKDKTDGTPANKTGLIGKWSWIESKGGVMGETVTPASSGCTEIIEFTADSVFRLFRNNTLNLETNFHITKTLTSLSLDSVMVIQYDDKPIRQTYSLLSTDKLLLSDQCYDSYSHEYVRVK